MAAFPNVRRSVGVAEPCSGVSSVTSLTLRESRVRGGRKDRGVSIFEGLLDRFVRDSPSCS